MELHLFNAGMHHHTFGMGTRTLKNCMWTFHTIEGWRGKQDMGRNKYCLGFCKCFMLCGDAIRKFILTVGIGHLFLCVAPRITYNVKWCNLNVFKYWLNKNYLWRKAVKTLWRIWTIWNRQYLINKGKQKAEKIFMSLSGTKSSTAVLLHICMLNTNNICSNYLIQIIINI